MVRILKTILCSGFAVLFSLAAAPVFADSEIQVTGGGIIKDGSGAAAKRITFAIDLLVDSIDLAAGNLHFRFHQLDDVYGLDRSRFTASDFDSVFIETHYFDSTPYTFIRIEARGWLDGEEGWSVLARFSDFGVPVRDPALPSTHTDALRIILFDPTGVSVYDSAFDYPREQSWRALLDGGNVAVHMRAASE